MSRSQSTLDSFVGSDADRSSRPDEKNSTPADTADSTTNQPTDDCEDDEVEILPELLDDESGHQCQSCGNPVSEEYARCCGDNSGEVHSCPNCSTVHENLRGATAGIDRDDGETLFQRLQRGDRL